MGKFNQYIEAAKKSRKDFIASTMMNRSAQNKCMTCGADAEWEEFDESGKSQGKFCSQHRLDPEAKNKKWKKLGVEPVQK